MLAGLTALLGGGGGGGGSFESIATVTASGGESSLSFTSIVGTYKHLQIRGIARNNFAANANDQLKLTFNGDTSGTTYSLHNLRGNGSTTTAVGSASNADIVMYRVTALSGSTSGIYGTSIIDIHNYSSTSQYKTVRYFGGGDLNGAGDVSLGSGLWQNTAAITSINIAGAGTTFISGTTFALYGIKG